MRNLIILCIAMLFASCTKSVKEQEKELGVSRYASIPSPNLIYEETFEGSVYFPLSGDLIDNTHSIESCGLDWTLGTVTSPLFQGTKSSRFELRKDMPLVGSSLRHRCEVVIVKDPDETDYHSTMPEAWYSFAVLFPRTGMEYDGLSRDIINQWFEDANSDNTIKVDKDRVYFEATPNLNSTTKLRFDLFGQTITKAQSNTVLDMEPFPKDEWHEFVFHFVHSFTDGLVDIYRDGVLIHKIRGRTMHYKYPKWKMGLYKADMLESLQYSRVIYFDNIRVGKQGTTLADMVSTTMPIDTIPTDTIVVPPPIIPTTIKSFTLINAGTDKDFSTITEGGSYSIAKIGSSHLSIRANSDSATSIKFELTGAKANTYTDDKIPFSLKGDNGSGNYYYLTFVAGSYTLKATPYKNSVTGTSSTIHFKIIK